MDKEKDHEPEDFVFVEDPDQAGTLEATLNWLTPTDYDGDGSEYRKHVGIRAPGTADWLFEHHDFKSWSSSTDRNLLWIKGVPGSGKSILASSVIERPRSIDGLIVAYFFFRRIIPSNCTFASMVRDIIAQISVQVPDIRQLVRTFMETHSNVDSISNPELWKLFVSVVSTLPRVCLVVDAWDEILPGEESLLATTLLELVSASAGSVKLLITSRPLLENLIRDFNPLIVRLSSTVIGPDVSTYIKYRLQTQSQRFHTSDEQDLIHEHLSKSLFLHASLMLDEIVKSPAPVHELLKRIPSSLADLYGSVLRQYAAEFENGDKMQRLLFPWILHCFRPLRLVELAHISLFYKLFEDVSVAKAAIRKCCGPLIEIRKDETVHVCHHSFAEFLLGSEFIDVEDGEGGFTQVNDVGSHKTLAITCLRYLLSNVLASIKTEDYWGSVSRDQPEKDPFLQYSSQYWQNHVVHVSAPDDEIFKLLDRLLRDDSHELKAWTKISKLSKSLKASDLRRLHIAAHFGLTAYVEYLLCNGLDVHNQANKLSRTALMFAVERGHPETALLLLAHGASTESTDIRGMSAVHLAVVGNHVQCLEALISSGANPACLIGPGSDESFESLLGSDNDEPRQFMCNLPGSPRARDTNRRLAGCSVIQLACRMGFDEVVKVLLPLFDTETRASISLNWAAEGGHADVLRTLLEYPELRENIDSKNQEGNTAIFAACRALRVQATKVLLSYGADPRIGCTDSAGRAEYYLKRARNDVHEGLTPLHAWAGLGSDTAEWPKTSQGAASHELLSCRDYIAIGEMLLERGADPNAATSQGQTALFQWPKKTTGDGCQSAFISLLLRYGADSAARDKLGATPLHMMTGLEEEVPAVSLLAADGADINATRSDGRSPIHMICGQRDAQPTSLYGLQALGAHFNKQDVNGDTPLHLAIKSWSQRIGPQDIEASLVELLKHSDSTIRNSIGETALFNVISGNSWLSSKMMIDKLMESGAELEARNNHGRTVFLEACRFRDTAISEFLRRDANIRAQDEEGRGCLHLLLGAPAYDSNVFAPKTRDIVQLVTLLCTNGARPDAVDRFGNTIFHEAASNAKPTHFKETESLRGLKALLELRYIGPTRLLQDRVNYLGQSPLHSAARRPKAGSFMSDTDAVEVIWFDFLLSPEVDLQANAADLAGVTPLHLSAPICEARVWRLLEAGADAACPAKNRRVPLHEAATGNVNSLAILCQKMMEADLSLDFADDNGETPLHEAARAGNLQAVKILVKSGADIARKNKKGLTALQIAMSVPLGTSDGDVESMAVDSVLESYQRRRSFHAHRGNLFGYHDKSFDIFLKLLARPDPLGIANFLASYGTPMIPILSKTEASGAVEAADKGKSEITATMNSGGQQDANTGDQNQGSGESESKIRMLLVAILKRQYDSIIEILETGIDLTGPIFYHDESILHALVRAGSHAVLEVMAPFIKDINDIKPPLLHVAVDRREINVDVIDLLLNIGADPNMTHKNMPNASRVVFPFFKPYEDHTVIQKLATGHFWWHWRALRMLAMRGSNLTTAHSLGYEYVDLCETNERRGINAGPYGRLCKEVITEIAPVPEPEYNPMTDLIPAITRGDLEAVRAMLEAGTDPNARYEDASSGAELLPLKACAEAWEQSILEHEQGHEEIPAIMTLLLKYGASPYKDDAFHHVCANNAPVKPFLDAGVDINARGYSGMTPLLSACSWYGYVPQGLRDIFALELLEAGADVNAQDENGQTPLHKTIVSECHLHTPQVVHALLRAGADTSLKDSEGHDAFFYLIRQRDDDCMYYKHEMAYDFLGRGADALGLGDEDGQNNLHVVLRNLGLLENSSSTTRELEYLVKTFHILLDKACDRNARDSKGNTPVFCFVETTVQGMADPGRRDLEWHRQFLKQFDLRAINNDGDTLLHVVARGSPNLIRRGTLFGSHSSGCHQDRDGAELFGLLVEMGVDPTAENGEGLSSLDVAASHDRQDILKLFADND
ncbi:ankyrin repeat-containing domain protein [Dactylonectria estremocensis]|uniref:Ankyrin repeat-containing domain protein n=1 Tax=Dactylonectria estremocensis TaxID=1079267 RepID=A0A9P9J514_9HYPO|nr:ankyrin repeat-containing domain protein [Dactylonectria estremocensis]